MKRKRLLCAVIALVIIISSIPIAGATEVSKYGFTYDDTCYIVQWKVMDSFQVKTSENGLLGTMSYVVGLARRNFSYDYILMTKETMTPYNKSVKINGVGQTGYGMSEYVSVKVVLPSLDNYSPQNSPTSDSVTLSLGADKDGASFEASYTLSHEGLVVTANCDTPEKKFHIIYDYKPHIANPVASNKYLAKESIQLGMAEFHSVKNTVSFRVYYDARFGAASKSSRSPWSVYMNYVRQNTDYEDYTFTINL